MVVSLDLGNARYILPFSVSEGEFISSGFTDADHRCREEATRTESQVTLQGLQRLWRAKPGSVEQVQKVPRPQLACEEARTRSEVTTIPSLQVHRRHQP